MIVVLLIFANVNLFFLGKDVFDILQIMKRNESKET